MKLEVRYETAYRYGAPVRFARHELRLFPRGDFFTQLLRVKFATNPDAKVRFGRDVFDNCVAACTYEEPAAELRFSLELDLALEKRNPFDFILAPEAETLPFTYPAELGRVLAPFQKITATPALEIPGWQPPQPNDRQPTVSTLVRLNEHLHACVGYERREEGPARSPQETLRIGRGACRDVAVLLAAILRDLGLAARLTSGYLREADAETKRAEGSLHAWTEVYLPGAGWIGIDPTNGIFCNHNFIAAAVGIEPGEVTPIDGVYYQRGETEAQMTSKIVLVNL